MKKFILLLFYTCLIQSLQAQEESYHGGSADGHAMQAIITPFGNANAFSPFFGGIADGNATDSFITFSQHGYITMFAPFSGGIANGHTTDNLIAFNQHGYIAMYQPFSGGQADGWTSYPVFGITILPVQLLSFSGEQQQGKHLLHWSTSQEINTSRFELERSQNGGSFLKLSSVAANGNSNGTLSYQYADESPMEGNNFYRLKIIDIDASFSYSPVILLRQSGTKSLMSIYPNPTTKSLNVLLGGAVNDSNVHLAVYDINGHLLKAVAWKKSGSMYSIDVEKLAVGIYVLQVIQNGETTVWRFIKN